MLWGIEVFGASSQVAYVATRAVPCGKWAPGATPGISIQDPVGPEFQEGRSLALLLIHFVRAAGPLFTFFLFLFC